MDGPSQRTYLAFLQGNAPFRGRSQKEMAMSRIPEVIDLDEQMEKLVVIAGDDNFKFIRERCGGDFLAVLDAEMKGADGLPKAPSRGVEELKKFLDATAIIRGKIAQLERDGFMIAGYEIRKALTYPGYRILGEIHPLAKTVPVTLVIFNPKLTLTVLGKSHPTEPQWLNAEDVPKELVLRAYGSRDLIFREDLLRTLRSYNQPLEGGLEKRLPKKYEVCRKFETSALLPNNPKMPTEVEGKGLGFAYYTKKSTILRCFTKKEQEQIAVWQFYLPKQYAGYKAHELYFGLHKQEEHAGWQNKRAPFCSTNTSNGYGAIAYPGEAYHCFDKRSARFKGTRILLY
ncbi:MAG: hypothetical protein ACD_81C00216G0001 [uncultured bacterium]|uniref:Uncharacterized protein n=1 Tax=Candidatus Wolfebacteria bacterium GW2011_GWE2_44_13 TaxID=1619017 RepID=A0A0G1HB88_9BACT|nr:MAG: hypothetical protein ACD_81C00216G0001 [uncultured bacterium]KKT43793.1 MAG: hypothetical protein UW32_C0001G0385 [Candidatus Wolfebacteria bacterium GW2011_GWE2_44_13]